MKKILSEEQKKHKAEYSRRWRKNNPEKTAIHAKNSRIKNKDEVKKRQRRWMENNKERHTKNSKDWYQKNKDRVRNRRLLKEFGISLEEYKVKLAEQGGACAICGGGPDAKSKILAVDHDHVTGRIRALLCRGCNVGIGNLKDDPALLKAAASYIEKFRKE